MQSRKIFFTISLINTHKQWHRGAIKTKHTHEHRRDFVTDLLFSIKCDKLVLKRVTSLTFYLYNYNLGADSRELYANHLDRIMQDERNCNKDTQEKSTCGCDGWVILVRFGDFVERNGPRLSIALF